MGEERGEEREREKERETQREGEREREEGRSLGSVSVQASSNRMRKREIVSNTVFGRATVD